MYTLARFVSVSRLLSLGSLVAVSLLASSASHAVTLIDEDFSDNNRDGWYSVGAATATGNTVSVTTSYSSGYALKFSGTSGNNAVVASFDAVTLGATGDYIEVSSVWKYDSIPTSVGTGPQIGLYNNAGSSIISDQLNSTFGSIIQDWEGYKATKRTTTATDDMRIYSQDPVGNTTNAFYYWSGTGISTDSSGYTFSAATLYTTTLRIELLENLTDVEITWTVSGGGETYTQTTTIAASTLTYNEVMLSAFSGQSATTAYLGDILVTTNVPEPAQAAALMALGGLIVAAVIRRRRR